MVRLEGLGQLKKSDGLIYAHQHLFPEKQILS
jgi:hypothetical protein